MTAALDVRGLSLGFDTPRGFEQVVDDVSFTVAPGEAVALVGESGCGKSVTARACLQLLPTNAKVLAGAVHIGGTDVFALGARALRRLRGREVGFVFQDPMTALNPVYPVGEQIAERLRRDGDNGRGLSRRDASRRAIELLKQVGIPAAADRSKAYPHQLSGGMCQRVGVAIALACDPSVVIADEPTTALDVTIQAQLMALIRSQQQARGMALLLITHDLGLVAQHVDRVVVMYAGQVVEDAPVEALFSQPLHPYTAGLLRAVPGTQGRHDAQQLWSIPGAVPPPNAFPSHCRFAARCHRAQPACTTEAPPMRVEGPRRHRCLFPEEASVG